MVGGGHVPHWLISPENSWSPPRFSALDREFFAPVSATTFGIEIEGGGLGYAAFNVVRAASPDLAWETRYDGSVSLVRAFEVVTPPMVLADLEKAVAGVRALTRAGMTANASCGVHVHVGARALVSCAGALHRLCRLVADHEDTIHELLGGGRSHNSTCLRFRREHALDAGVSPAFLELLDGGVEVSAPKLLASIYRGGTPKKRKHVAERYMGLNLHAVRRYGTVEFRWYPASRYAARIRAWVILSLALVRAAIVDAAGGALVNNQLRSNAPPGTLAPRRALSPGALLDLLAIPRTEFTEVLWRVAALNTTSDLAERRHLQAGKQGVARAVDRYINRTER